nr:MAG TPA: hypothetical protein [Bacteriophage sp.]
MASPFVVIYGFPEGMESPKRAFAILLTLFIFLLSITNSIYSI